MMYNALIEQFKLAQATAADAYRAVASAEISLFPGLKEYERATRLRHDYKLGRELTNFCVELSGVVVRVARREMAPAGTVIEIDRDAELKAARIDIGEAIRSGGTPDLDAFWAHLKQKFAGDAGASIAYQQAAKAIIDGFWLKPTTEMKRTSNGIVIDASVGSEVSFSSPGWRRVGSYSQTGVANLIMGLTTFAVKAGHTTLAGELRTCRLVGDEYQSRDRQCFTGMEVVRYNDKWQFKFAHAVGDEPVRFLVCRGHETITEPTSYDRCNSDQEEQESEGTEAVSR